MAIESSWFELAALGVGLVIGAVLMNLLGRRAGRADRERADQLETELEQTREELEVHREDVARHFQQTSDLFRDVTEHYTRLYAHLATGARSFSTGEVPALGQLDQTLIGEAAPRAPDKGGNGSDTQASAPAASGNGAETSTTSP